ncbi:MAG: radical SAM protein [Candidatus Heimdallarchaeota archaeon]|nr:radical SAM protein [Candidatus Heimdallarchaeota archaeon]
MKIRASIGTAVAAGLETVKVDVLPTTAYIMMNALNHCSSNCSFCPQARESSGKADKLSRVIWPMYELEEILKKMLETPNGLKRLCIQTVQFPSSDENLLEILAIIKNYRLSIPISVCSYPVNKEIFQQMKELGVSRVGISFDCATEEIFDKVKGKKRGKTLTWKILEEAIEDAIQIFGNRFVSTHLIIGLGETEEEAIKFIQRFYERKITIGLFAFTPVQGTDLENQPKPAITLYRRIQLAKYLIEHNHTNYKQMTFRDSMGIKNRLVHFGLEAENLKLIIKTGKAFETSGCSHCNRPFYNESPGKELYNFPRILTNLEKKTILKEFEEFL